MDPDLSEFEEPPRQRPCKVRTALTELEPERSEKLAAALKGQFSHTKVAAVVTGWGFPLSDQAVGTHRRGGCSCG